MNHDPRLYFLALAEERDLKRAALRWGVTQRTIRTSIAQMEKDYGAELCVIQTKKARLTEAGKRLRRSLCSVDVDDDVFRRIGIMEDTQSEHGISAWMKQVAIDCWPSIGVEVSKGNFKEQVQRIYTGAIDLALLYGWPTADFSRLTFRKLYDEEMMAFLAHEPAASAGPIDLPSLCQRTWVMPSTTLMPGIDDLLSWECRKESLNPRRSIARTKSRFLEAIRHERAVGFAPANFLAVLPPEIVKVPLSRRITIPFGCVHRSHEASTAVHRFINMMCRLTRVQDGAAHPLLHSHSVTAETNASEEDDQIALVIARSRGLSKAQQDGLRHETTYTS